ncbi:MAG: hypothetical protein FJ291_19850, partial [Planctomycetes bacterium]|nr:hypothetical protein [Planctomycetota bacterium]
LKRAGVPVVATSANRSGEPDATSAAEVIRSLGDDLDIILDGGRTTYREASTVVRVAADGSWEVLREGSVTKEMLRRTLAKATSLAARRRLAARRCHRDAATQPQALSAPRQDRPHKGRNRLQRPEHGRGDPGRVP